MPSDTPLDLNNVDPAVWRVRAGETIYGPYTLGQMKVFTSEGRIASHTMVCKGDMAAFKRAAETPEIAEILSKRPAQAEGEQGEATLTNYVVVAQAEGANPSAVTATLNTLGRFVEAAPGVFILRSQERLAKIRDRLGSFSGVHDRFVIVDADHSRLAWLGLDPDTDAHIRSVWNQDIS